jgi:hypothetical protein
VTGRGAPALAVLSGIPPGPGGVGRVLAWLEASAAGRGDVAFGYPGPRKQGSLGKAARTSPAAFFREAAFRLRARGRHARAVRRAGALEAGVLVFVHPSSYGYRRFLSLVERREGATWLYVMDGSWFCVRSYNYLDGERGPCLRCLGGDFAAAGRMGCRPFPERDPFAFRFVRRLPALVRAGRVRLLVQSSAQARLVRRHFGAEAHVRDVGLWAVDWDEITGAAPSPERGAARAHDVVFHGASVPAKGVGFALELARRCPALRFLVPEGPGLFPTELRPLVPPNCTVAAMTWETGLGEAVRDAALVLVPSLWSAPIEGALVKSIALARAVAVVENEGAFASDLPEGLCLVLPADPAAAAERLSRAVAEGWRPAEELRRGWVEAFAASQRQLLERLLALAI